MAGNGADDKATLDEDEDDAVASAAAAAGDGCGGTDEKRVVVFIREHSIDDLEDGLSNCSSADSDSDSGRGPSSRNVFQPRRPTRRSSMAAGVVQYQSASTLVCSTDECKRGSRANGYFPYASMSRTASTSAASSYSSSAAAAAAAAAAASSSNGGPMSWSSGPLGCSHLMKDFGDLRNEFDIWMWIREDSNVVDPPKAEQHPAPTDASTDYCHHHHYNNRQLMTTPQDNLPAATRLDHLARDTSVGQARTGTDDKTDWTYVERKSNDLEMLRGLPDQALGGARRPVRFESFLQSSVEKPKSPLKPPAED